MQQIIKKKKQKKTTAAIKSAGMTTINKNKRTVKAKESKSIQKSKKQKLRFLL